MVFSLQTNIASLRAVRILGGTMNELMRVSERLSSGQRLQNDSAGRAIADSLSSRARVFSQARRNVSDATSFVSIADSTLEQVTNLTARMQELAQQGANGTFSKQQRISMQEEINALDQEIRRITSSSKFNGMQIFDRSPNSGGRTLVESSSTSSSVDVRGRYLAYYSGIPPANEISFYDSVEGDSLTLNSGVLSGWMGGAFINSVSVKEYTVDDKVVLSLEHASGEDMFLYDFATGQEQQLTNSSNTADQSKAKISADGSTVFFLARSEYVNGGTKDDATGSSTTNPGLYALDVATGKIWTNGEEFSGTISNFFISPDGTKGAFSNAAGKFISVQISETGMESSVLFSGNSMTARGLTDDGKLIVTSTSDLVGNGNSLRQIFEVDISSGATTQLTNFEETKLIQNVALSLDGTMVNFSSTSDFTGENSDGSTEFFQFDRITNRVVQLTDGNHGTLNNIHLSADGKTAFATDSGGDLHQYSLTPDEKNHVFQVGYGTSGTISAGISDIRRMVAGLGSIQVTSAEAAREGVDRLSSNLAGVGALRGQLGASLSRMSYAENTIALQRDEILAAESRIRDVDVASEAAELVRIQILQQAAVATLAQANAQPSLLLRLLSI